MKRIAFSGMKGRKRDTFLLATVIFLSFVFVVTAIVFHGSSEQTKIEQRKQAFGQWENAYFNGNEEVGQRLKKLDNVEKIGQSRIVGRSNRLGLVGSIDDQLKSMGNFQFQSGRLPDNENEIAIELNQLGNFHEEVKVGDKISVAIDITLIELGDEEIWEDIFLSLGPELRDMAKAASINPLDPYYETFRRMDFEEIEDLHFYELYNDYWNEIDIYGRNTPDMEFFDGTRVDVIKDYMLWSMDGDVENLIKDIEEVGVKSKERVILTREMTVSGIINTYSDRWDIENYPVANAFITEKAAENFIEGGIYKTEKAAVELYKPSKNFFIVGEHSSQEFYNENKDSFENLKRNTYSYPSSGGSTDNVLTYGILAFIFIGTIFSVFQIYLTQMKRRTRKLALLKAIGGTNKQVRKILLWEILFLLVAIVPLSIIVGLIGVKLIIFIMNNYRGSQTIFYLDIKLVTLGILAAIISVFVGMMIPMIKSMRVPLRGDISEAPKRKKRSTREIIGSQEDPEIKKQSFSQISNRHNKYRRGKNILTVSLYTITIVVLLATIFSGFLSFGEYIDMVIGPNKPDYQLNINYGMRAPETNDLVNKIRQVKGIENAYGYKFGEGAYLWYEGMENNPIINSYKDLLTPHFKEEVFGLQDNYVNLTDKTRHLVSEGFKVSTYAVGEGSLEYNKLVNSISQGQIDIKSFENGDEVIVLMPIYRKYQGNQVEIDGAIFDNTNIKNRMSVLLSESNVYDLSYDFRDKEYYNINKYLNIGEKIHLTVPTEDIRNNIRINDVRFIDTKVGAIINYFPNKAIWPFSNTIENPLIIGSYKLINKMYPNSRWNWGTGLGTREDLESLIATYYPTRYANTLVTIYTNNNFDEIKDFIEIQRIAKEAKTSVVVLADSNSALKDKSLTTSIIIGVLGISIGLITLLIQYNTSLSNIEQERERIGSLQALGVEGDGFKKLYLATGIKYGLISIIIGHIFIALVLIITTIIEVGSISLFLQSKFLSILKNKLWLYPWKLHLATCIIFLIWTVITYYLPIRKIVENQPVDNIRSLTR